MKIPRKIRTTAILILCLILVVLLASTGCIKKQTDLNVSAAASLTDALKEINSLYLQQNSGVALTANFAGSGTLQKQIEQGAPADVFISAAPTQMDSLQNQGLILSETRRDLLNNNVVLIVPDDNKLNITGFADLAGDNIKRIAIGDPKFVPAGTYAQQIFDELGIADQIQTKLILGSDVRQVLSYVESGNVDAGIVYSTDALASDKVKVVASAPEDINAKVAYPVAVIKSSNNADPAKTYINFLFSHEARLIFEKFGFSMADK